jgi:cell division protein FtsI/penicillin-binding protein 2
MVFNSKKRAYAVGSQCEIKKGNTSILKNFRLYVLTGWVIILFALIVFRLYSLQVSAYDFYRTLADNQHTILRELTPKRGEIFFQDRTGLYQAAVNRDTKMVYAVPSDLENVETVANFLTETLSLSKDELLKRLDNQDDRYEPIKHRLSEEEIEKIQNSKIKGLHLADENYRYYPSGELAANALGFVGWKSDELVGRYGIEAKWEEKLRGEKGKILQDKDTAGNWITTRERSIIKAKNGHNLVLTIDHIIQYETEKILRGAVEKNLADSGLMIVMEPSTGRIFSMASYPTFDPNNYSQVENIDFFNNLAVSVAYECGSVFKPITMAAAINEGKINPDTTYVDTGQVHEAGYTIKNSDLKAYGRQTMTQVLEKSLNTGAIYAQKTLGNRNFADYVEKFGFGSTTGVDLYNESQGNIRNLNNLKRTIQFYTAAFGQGITVTPIQLISAFSAIANGGAIMKPQIVDKIIYDDGQEENIASQEIRRVISQTTSYKVSQMLGSVVTNGHGKKAGVPGYQVAGKTGTAQVASTTARGYEEGKTIGSFVGFAPLDNPKFAILVKMDNPKNVQWAESSAAPAFGELMKFLLEYYDIEPTQAYTQKEMDDFNQTHNLKKFYLKMQNEKKKENKKEEESDEINQ